MRRSRSSQPRATYPTYRLAQGPREPQRRRCAPRPLRTEGDGNGAEAGAAPRAAAEAARASRAPPSPTVERRPRERRRPASPAEQISRVPPVGTDIGDATEVAGAIVHGARQLGAPSSAWTTEAAGPACIPNMLTGNCCCCWEPSAEPLWRKPDTDTSTRAREAYSRAARAVATASCHHYATKPPEARVEVRPAALAGLPQATSAPRATRRRAMQRHEPLGGAPRSKASGPMRWGGIDPKHVLGPRGDEGCHAPASQAPKVALSGLVPAERAWAQLGPNAERQGGARRASVSE